MTFSRTAAHRLPFLLGATLALAASFTAVDAGLYAGQPREMPAAAYEVTGPELVAEHGCWTGEAPADMQGVFPGHVVVTVDGLPQLRGEQMVGQALEQVFDGTDHGLTVWGFCR